MPIANKWKVTNPDCQICGRAKRKLKSALICKTCDYPDPLLTLGSPAMPWKDTP